MNIRKFTYTTNIGIYLYIDRFLQYFLVPFVKVKEIRQGGWGKSRLFVISDKQLIGQER